MQALGNCLEAASQAAANGGKEDGIAGLVQRWMFPLVKKGLLASNLAVRQVCVPDSQSHNISPVKSDCYPGQLCVCSKRHKLSCSNATAYLMRQAVQRKRDGNYDCCRTWYLKANGLCCNSTQ